eukprot:4773724-Prymnesium_polylepis.1
MANCGPSPAGLEHAATALAAEMLDPYSLYTAISAICMMLAPLLAVMSRRHAENGPAARCDVGSSGGAGGEAGSGGAAGDGGEHGGGGSAGGGRGGVGGGRGGGG